LYEKLIEKIKPFFGDGYDLPVFSEINRQKIGEGMDEHCDMGSRSSLLRSMLFYINDDYEGGELYFPALNFEYKPKAGDFITFPSYEKYTHGVRPVLSGSNRYVVSGFAWAAGKMPN
jgi:predicted 2-oxoglutarate/Fe(II)-dependent dioxygenase YbiX